MVKKQGGLDPLRVQKSGHVDDDIQISALDVVYEIDGRRSRHISEVLDWYREEDAGDLKRSELNEFVENMACLTALEGKFWRSEKSWESEKVTRTS